MLCLCYQTKIGLFFPIVWFRRQASPFQLAIVDAGKHWSVPAANMTFFGPKISSTISVLAARTKWFVKTPSSPSKRKRYNSQWN